MRPAVRLPALPPARLAARLPVPARRSLVVLLAVLLGATAAAPVPAAGAGAPREARAAARAWDVPARATVTVSGHGYGHGHGMSQYGAEGAARQGLDARRILGFYYPGTTEGRVGGMVSVLVSADTTDDVVVLARRGLRVKALATGRTWMLPANGASRWRLHVNPNGSTGLVYRTDRWRRWRVFRGQAEFFAGGAPITLVTPAGTRAYRGRLRAAAPVPGGRARDTVNVLTLENYLRGVVPLEIPASWRPAAVQAQAVAARTYAAYERAHPRARHHQLCDTTSCQVYGGASAENPLSDAAIRATAGLARLHQGRPAFTQFSSSSGGWTSAGVAPYLPAQRDPYDGWAGNPVHDWSVRLTDLALERAYPRIGDLRRITVLERDGNGDLGGRVRRLELTGGRGSVTVSGDALRSALGLRSSWFTFAVAPR